MIWSKRERYAGIAAAAVVGVLALDRLVFTPLLREREELRQRITEARIETNRTERLRMGKARMAARWDDMLRKGVGGDASAAESRVLNSMRDWAQASGQPLSSLKPERNEKQAQFQRVTFRATANGGMRGIAQLLSRVEAAGEPVRITDVQLGSRKDGVDDLSLQLGVSTIYLAPPEAKSADGGSTAAAEERR